METRTGDGAGVGLAEASAACACPSAAVFACFKAGAARFAWPLEQPTSATPSATRTRRVAARTRRSLRGVAVGGARPPITWSPAPSSVVEHLPRWRTRTHRDVRRSHAARCARADTTRWGGGVCAGRPVARVLDALGEDPYGGMLSEGLARL